MEHRTDAADLASLAAAVKGFAAATWVQLSSASAQQAPLEAPLPALIKAAEGFEDQHAAALAARGPQLLLNECCCGDWVPWKLTVDTAVARAPGLTPAPPRLRLPRSTDTSSPAPPSPLSAVMQCCRWLANVCSKQVLNQVSTLRRYAMLFAHLLPCAQKRSKVSM